jgi:hypothetical protein
MNLWSHPLGMARSARATVALALFALTGCASGVDSPAVVTLPRQMSATIDSVAWVASSVQVASDATVIRLTSSIGQGGAFANIILQFHRSGLGEQLLDGITGGWYGELTGPSPSGLWMTGYRGAKGTVTLTTLTSSRAVGTFQFDAGTLLPVAGSPDIRTVRNGSFDVTF